MPISEFKTGLSSITHRQLLCGCTMHWWLGDYDMPLMLQQHQRSVADRRQCATQQAAH